MAFVLLWGFIYYFFNLLHGMQSMFDHQFPFLFSTLLGIHNETMSFATNIFYTMLDAAVLGFILDWLVKRILFGK